MHVEKLGGAPIQAHALTLVELGLPVVVGNALLLADLVQATDSHRYELVIFVLF